VSQEGTGLSSENWVAQQLGGGPEESCRMPLLGKPGGGRSAKGRDRGIKENSPKGGARSIPDIKPPSCISWVPSSSDSEATSGLGATLQGGGGAHTLLATTVQGTDRRHRASDHLHGGPGA